MASGAARLIDRVLPDVTVRQWSIQTGVLRVPWPRRYLFAARPEVCAGVRRLSRPANAGSVCPAASRFCEAERLGSCGAQALRVQAGSART